jgi:hypothetical protein
VLVARGVRSWADARGRGRSSAGCYTGCCQRLGALRRDGEQMDLHTYARLGPRRIHADRGGAVAVVQAGSLMVLISRAWAELNVAEVHAASPPPVAEL